MARVNTRPDIIYVKDLTEQDKDCFEKILNKFRTTNNGEAVKKLFSEFLKNEELRIEQSKEILKLQSDLQNAEKEKKKFLSDTDKLINSISTVEESLKKAKIELTKLK
ncbi:hypothetical protein [Chryseobacterium sp. 5_R23647]|uniref:hypothetical protein n=1 Tax=Chryseobacterium sp. 5_R23647 TaxID=2258964 RepID=UPI000E21DED4|nr:hypothetical protein [Chryseobacterium sp. 5_R23647]REC40929.1 hypothetical protein DRF69_16875 [Chryseobacterium sp. 5_R23647]